MTDVTTEPTAVATGDTQQGVPIPENALGFVDIENAVKAIDLAAEGGAYKGWQVINEVLNIRNRLVVFLLHAKEAMDAAQAAEAVTGEGTDPELTVTAAEGAE
jgi:hypothetical protein